MLQIVRAAQAFEFPFIEPYLRHFDDDAYRRGVNFAISASTATTIYSQPGTGFYLERQTEDYLEFRTKHTGQTCMLLILIIIQPPAEL